MPIIASGHMPTSTSASNTTNFGQKPNSGGMPARLNMNIANAAASPGRVRDRPDSAAIVSTGLPSASRIWRTHEQAAQRHRDIDRHVDQHAATRRRRCPATRPNSAKPTLLIDE